MPQKILNLPFSFSLEKEVSALKENKTLTLVNVGNTTAKAFLISKIQHRLPFSNIFWHSADERADQLKLSADLWFGENLTLVPEHFSYRDFYEILKNLHSPTTHVFLFENFENIFTQKLPTPNTLKNAQITLKVGEKIKIYDFFGVLESIGYRSAEDRILQPGEFLRRGESLFLYPLQSKECVRIEMCGDEIEKIENYPQNKTVSAITAMPMLHVFPAKFLEKDLTGTFLDWTSESDCFIGDDTENETPLNGNFYKIQFTTFPQNDSVFFHLNFFSVLPFYTILDFVVEIKERLRRNFSVVVMTKKFEEIEKIFRENDIMFTENLEEKFPSTVYVIRQDQESFLPHSFQNSDKNLYFLTDREIFQFKRTSRQKKVISGMNFDLINSLKPHDFVVHLDHGIAQFEGMITRKTAEGIREYLKLKYLGSDRLFVPVESAEKVTKFVGSEEPRLTKLGGVEWQTVQKKLKQEAERIASELLQIYAKRELSLGRGFFSDDEMMKHFCDGFPYELTPGQNQSWEDVRIDMERVRPMDRLVCGDVGFGKTEIAMRAAFKCFRSGMQCAFLSPITILAEQHYQSFYQRILNQNYGIRIELLSRFQSIAEQKKILKDLEFGLVDVVIGTHRLLSEDIKFKNLGLLIIDEEQRFGVKQKEKLKGLRSNIDILTLTATPIPRTLHLGLNKLKDVSTITTPPPGRLPVITEVRRYHPDLIRERILFEINRGGQIYFLHNEVRTIESYAKQLKSLIPEANFIVAHGQLAPHDLEERIRRFKNGEADVLIASTIIENGIDLPNANTLFVNRAEKFGLSQLYQLRGRVGRSRTQAYAFFLYQGQKLEVDAKKRLRAIVEASELGAGFQIAMKDLEIRGAGEILGANQSGAMKDAGVSHFVRLLNKTVEELKSGERVEEVETEENVTVEIPLSAFIPPQYIPNSDEKIQVYQELAGAETPHHLEEIKKDLREDYGEFPREVENLCKVIRLKLALKAANLSSIRVNKISHKSNEIMLRMGKNFSPEQVFGLLKHSKKSWIITANSLKLKLENLPITWYSELLEDIELLAKKG